MAKNNISIKKAKLFITIVDRNKVEFYTDVLSQYESNLQLVMYGNGTASLSTLRTLGLTNEKGIIFSVIRDDLVNKVKDTLDTKFKTIRNGKGISVVVPISSVMGKSLYQFMINNRQNRGDLNE